jgi:hypothetical protein
MFALDEVMALRARPTVGSEVYLCTNALLSRRGNYDGKASQVYLITNTIYHYDLYLYRFAAIEGDRHTCSLLLRPSTLQLAVFQQEPFKPLPPSSDSL